MRVRRRRLTSNAIDRPHAARHPQPIDTGKSHIGFRGVIRPRGVAVTRPQHSNAACWPDRCLGSLRWIVAGVVWHGITIRTLQRIWLQLIERLSGPMAFRFILQPLMAAVA